MNSFAKERVVGVSGLILYDCGVRLDLVMLVAFVFWCRWIVTIDPLSFVYFWLTGNGKIIIINYDMIDRLNINLRIIDY